MNQKKIEFDFHEFECHCNYPSCNRKEQFLRIVNPLKQMVLFLMNELDSFKDFVRIEKKTENVIMKITSGARCVRWNKEKKGVENSFHLYNDIRFVAFDTELFVDGKKLSDSEIISLLKKYFGKKIVYIAPTSGTKGAIHVTMEAEI